MGAIYISFFYWDNLIGDLKFHALHGKLKLHFIQGFRSRLFLLLNANLYNKRSAFQLNKRQ